jgi:hypothetical protein
MRSEAAPMKLISARIPLSPQLAAGPFALMLAAIASRSSSLRIGKCALEVAFGHVGHALPLGGLVARDFQVAQRQR